MGRRRERYYGGLRLVDHLYPDQHGREGWWRYRRPDRSFKVFRATVEEANELAEEANGRRHLSILDPSSMAYAVERYISHAEQLRPSLGKKESWRNRKYAMRAFAEHFPARTVPERKVWEWWDGLTHSQQILREAEFRRMWVFFQREGYADSNPFDKSRILRREKPTSERERLTLPGFWSVYKAAPEGLQVAMGISLLTTMRRGDVVSLTRQNVQDGYLRKVISKSEEKRGVIKAARLQWKLSEHPQLARLIQRGLDSAPSGCPYIVHDKPLARRLGSKVSVYQMLPDRLGRLFVKARLAAGVGGEHPPTFHEVRSLGSFLLAQQGEQITDIQELMAHSDETMTALYQSGHPLPWQTVAIKLKDAGGAW
jgi:integrase